MQAAHRYRHSQQGAVVAHITTAQVELPLAVMYTEST